MYSNNTARQEEHAQVDRRGHHRRLAATVGCGQAHGEDAGPTVSRNYQVGDFHQIEVAGPYDVEVRTGAKAGVSAQGGEKLLGTVVEVEGDKLMIHPEEQSRLVQLRLDHHGKAKFVVTVPALSAAQIAGSGDIKVDQVKGESFEGGVAGSGGLGVGSLEVQTLKLDIAGSGGVKAGAGKAKTAEYEIAGSGDIDAGGGQANRPACRSPARATSVPMPPEAPMSDHGIGRRRDVPAAPNVGQQARFGATSTALKADLTMSGEGVSMRTFLIAAAAASPLPAPAGAATRNSASPASTRSGSRARSGSRSRPASRRSRAASGSPASLDRVAIEVRGDTLVVQQCLVMGRLSRQGLGPVEISLGTHDLSAAWLNGSGALSIDRVKALTSTCRSQGSGAGRSARPPSIS